MSPRDPLVNVTEALLHANEYTVQSHQAGVAAGGPPLPPPTALTVAFSREAGSGGTAVAREVGRRLNWPVYDNELLEQIATDLRVSVHLVQSVDERPGSWLQEWAEGFAGAPTVSEPAYFRRLLRLLGSLGARGDCVIVGRGAAQVLPAATTLRVRVIASREDRVAAVRRDLGLSAQEAASHVDATDRERGLFVRNHFRRDPADPQNYDLVLNASRFLVAECADIVVEALSRLRARTTGPTTGAGGKQA